MLQLQPVFKYIPFFKGKNRCYRYFFQSDIQSKKDVDVNSIFDVAFRLPNINESIGFEIYFNGAYEKETLDFILKRLPSNSTFLDIGANIGSILLPVAKKRPDIKVHGIEASPRVFEYLTDNLSKNNLPNGSVYNYAVSDQNEQEVKFYSPKELFGKGSMSSVFTKDYETVKTIKIDTLISDEKIQNISFIKVDIEGYEYYAFKGAEMLLMKQNAPDILFEFSDWSESKAKGLRAGDAQALLLSFGYTLYLVERKNKLIRLDGSLTSGDKMIYATKKSI